VDRRPLDDRRAVEVELWLVERVDIGLVEGRAFDRADAPWSDLASVTRSSDHLFLRCRIRAGAAGPP